MNRYLLDAYATLLGAQPRRGGQIPLHQLDVSVIRRAYRRLAVMTHPDAASRAGSKPGTVDGKRFIEASRAYELLMGYLLAKGAGMRTAPAGTHTARPRPAPPTPRSTGEKAAKGSGPTSTGGSARTQSSPLHYHGSLPRRRLRLAEFLYYSGRVSWQSLISAIVWQRAARPKFGELAKELRAITRQDLTKILGSKRRHEQTGETARRLRLLTTEEVTRILRLQRARHKPIGRYFIEKERMPRVELTVILRELFRHNARYSREA
jgi:hypothetical protein